MGGARLFSWDYSRAVFYAVGHCCRPFSGCACGRAAWRQGRGQSLEVGHWLVDRFPCRHCAEMCCVRLFYMGVCRSVVIAALSGIFFRNNENREIDAAISAMLGKVWQVRKVVVARVLHDEYCSRPDQW